MLLKLLEREVFKIKFSIMYVGLNIDHRECVRSPLSQLASSSDPILSFLHNEEQNRRWKAIESFFRRTKARIENAAVMMMRWWSELMVLSEFQTSIFNFRIHVRFGTLPTTVDMSFLIIFHAHFKTLDLQHVLGLCECRNFLNLFSSSHSAGPAGQISSVPLCSFHSRFEQLQRDEWIWICSRTQ